MPSVKDINFFLHVSLKECMLFWKLGTGFDTAYLTLPQERLNRRIISLLAALHSWVRMREVLLFLQLDRFVALYLIHHTSVIFEWDGAAFCKAFPRRAKKQFFKRIMKHLLLSLIFWKR